ncbi:MAG: hypothetical protein V9E98_06105 [Candidatus Nanopelagicales bacterium]
MSPGNQSRTTRWVVIAFLAGGLVGFLASLLRAHPVSPYRDDLEHQRLGR